MSTATLARAQAAVPPSKKKSRVWRCQFCAEGHHASCPRAVRHGPKLWLCECTLDGHHELYCLDCKHTGEGEVCSTTWTCFDKHGCAARQQQRRDTNPVWRMIHRAKVHGAVERKAKRQNRQKLLAGVSAADDDAIDRVAELLNTINGLKREPKVPKPRKPKPKPTTGKCECCGDPTKGGRFLPGHDARLASRLVQRALSGDAEALEDLKRRNWLKKIPAAGRAKLGVTA